MITFQNGYNADNINSQKAVVSFGGYIPQESVFSTASGTFAKVSGLFNRFQNDGISVVNRTSSGVLYDSTVIGSGALADVVIVNRTAVTGLFANVFIDDKAGFTANLSNPLVPSGGIRLAAGESFKPDSQVNFIGVLGSGFSLDFYARVDRNYHQL
jgi:hypothetical protein